MSAEPAAGLLSDHAILRAVCGRTEVIELPKSILLPGLVNAHVHLELSNCECGEALQGTFADWILGIREKMRIDPENVEASVSAAVKNGIVISASTASRGGGRRVRPPPRWAR